MPILGTDTSKWQPIGTYDPGAFEIINAEDPGMPAKVARHVADGRPWSLYVWQYARDSAVTLVERLERNLERAKHTPSLLDGWWDFEDVGVSQATLEAALLRAEARGLTTGYYTNDWRVALTETLRRFAFWLAAYPGDNSGRFPGLSAMRASRDVQLWQFTSTNGTLDQNVVVDEAWYDAVTDTGGFLMGLSGDEQREILEFTRLMREGEPMFGVPKLLLSVAAIERSVAAHPEVGIEAVAPLLSRIRNDLDGTAPLRAGIPSTRALLASAADGDSLPAPVPPVEDTLRQATDAELVAELARRLLE